MSEPTQPVISFEQAANSWKEIAGYFANFATGIVEAYKTAGDKAPDILAATRARYDVAIAAAIARRELALAAGDVFLEGAWRQVADQMAASAFKLADETKSAADRLLSLQIEINGGLRAVGKLVGPAFDIFAVADAIRSGDGNKTGEAVVSIGLAGLGTAVFAGAAFSFGVAAPGIALAGGLGAVTGALFAEPANQYIARPYFYDQLGKLLPDGFWKALEIFTFGEGAARLDPSGAVFTTMLLGRIDNTIQLADLGRLFDVAASAREGRETIGLLNQLGKIFTPNAPPLSNTATDAQLIAYAGRIAAVTDRAPGGVRITASAPTASEARSDFGVLLSLQMGNTVSIRLTDQSSTSPAALELYALHRTDYERWLSDSNVIAQGGDRSTLHFSDSYLQARTEFVSALTLGGVEEIPAIGGGSVSVSPGVQGMHFKDVKSGIEFDLGLPDGVVEKRQTLFGGDGADTFTGKKLEDRLYGGGGNDTIDGKGGSDYLEGNDGNDNLKGGEGQDTLLGGTGDDTLDGGKEADVLKGGQGADTYILRASDSGTDTITDADGLGSIKVIAVDGSETILGTGGIKKIANGINTWQSEDKRFTYTTSLEGDGSTTLLLTGAGVTARVKNFTSGNLGITLPGAPAAEPTPAPVAATYNLGTYDGNRAWASGPGNAQVGYHLLNAVQPEPGDTTPSASWEQGFNGNDLIEGGAIPAISQTVVRGNGGNDRIYAQVAQDLQQAIEQGETQPGSSSSNYLLDGGAGNDRLIGSSGADALFGGAGDDTIVGGAGSDLIVSDGDAGNIASATGTGWVTGSNNAQTGQARSLDIVHEGARLYLSPSDSTGQRTPYYSHLTAQLDMTYDLDYRNLRTLVGQDIRNLGYTYDGAVLDSSTLIGSKTVHASGDFSYSGSLIARESFNTARHTGNDTIYAGAGDDVVNAGGGTDTVLAGSGQDIVVGGAGDDFIFGGEGNDRLDGDAEGATAETNSNMDFYTALLKFNVGLDVSRHGADFIDGENGNDVIFGNGQSDFLFGGTGDDEIYGDGWGVTGAAAGDDYLEGEAGNDRLFGGAGADYLDGGTGDDFLLGDMETDAVTSQGDDYLDGGDGNDEIRGAGGDDTLEGGKDKDLLFGDAGNDSLSGGDGVDELQGGDGDDVLNGGAGADVLFGQADNDELWGGEGIDKLQGGAGDDFLDGGDGADALFGNADNDELLGGEGADYLNGGSGNDTLMGGADNDALLGNWGHDVLVGGSGDDLLEGGAGDDVLVADGGDDVLVGGEGNDTYVIQAGAGNVTLDLGTTYRQPSSVAGLDRVVLAGSKSLTTWTAALSGNSLMLTAQPHGSPNISGIRLEGYFDTGSIGSAWEAARIEFEDGTEISQREVFALAMAPTEGDDYILGLSGDDVLKGLGGNDELVGKGGNDEFYGGPGTDSIYSAGNAVIHFDRGDGTDIVNLGGGPGDRWATTNIIKFGPQILSSNITVRARPGGYTSGHADMELRTNTQELLILRSAFSPSSDPQRDLVDRVEFADGTVWDQAELRRRVTMPTESADYIYSIWPGTPVLYGLDGRDSIYGGDGPETLDGGNGDDILRGGGGNDRYVGGPGADWLLDQPYMGSDDTYVFNAGDGVDWVNDSGGTDTVEFGPGVASDKVGVWIGESGRSLILQMGGGDRITIANTLDSDRQGPHSGAIEFVKFADGTVWDWTRIQQEASKPQIGTSQSDEMWGLFSANNHFSGEDGNDDLLGADGDDFLAGGRGNDDLLGGLGRDTLDGGSDNDYLGGGFGNDIYLFGRGDGQDRIDESNEIESVPGKLNILRFKPGITAGEVVVQRSGVNLELLIAGTTDKVTLVWAYATNTVGSPLGPAMPIQQIEFADGTVWDLPTLSGLIDKPANRPPTAQNDSAIALEDGPSVSGSVLANDSDPDAGQTLAVTNAGTYAGVYGQLTLATDGSYTYQLDNTLAAVQTLGRDATLVEQFNYSITDDSTNPKTSSATLNLVIRGSNDGPLVQVDLGAAAEDGAAVAGNVLANDTDIDAGDSLSVADPGTYQGNYGSLALAADGSYIYTLDNAAVNVQGLRGGQQVSDNFTYTATDGLASADAQLTITITGSNDGPQANADAASTQEDAAFAASGNVLSNDSDVDQGTVLSVSNAGVFAGQYGSLTLSGDGSYAYALNHTDAAVQALGRNASVTDVFDYTVSDDDATPLSASSQLTVTVHGSNDGPVAAADVAEVTEDGTVTVSGNVLANDSDVDAGDSLSVAHAGTYAGQYGSLVLAADGSYTYTLDNTATSVQQLGQGQTLVEQFAYTTTDGLAEAAATLAVTVVGANDAPIVVTALADQTGRENQSLSFTLPATAFTDRDQGDTLGYSAWLVDENDQLQALPSWLSFNATTRSFSATPGATHGGDYQVRMVATDGSGAIAFDDFNLSIADQGSQGNGTILGSNGSDTLNGGSGDESLYAGNGDDLLFGNRGDDYLSGGNGVDILYAGSGNDKLYGGNGDDELYGEAGNDLLDGGNGKDLLIDLQGNNTLYAGNDDDTVMAGAGNDTIYADNGSDVVQAGAGSDVIVSGNENDLVDAGAGDDRISTGNSDDWIAAGKGNDLIDGGNGRNLYAFNRGDGADTLSNSGNGRDTVSLGHSIRYADLSLTKTGNDLVLGMGQGDSMTLKDWYVGNNSKGVEKLQVITVGGDYDASSTDKTRNQPIEVFDFGKLVQKFDAARTSNAANANGWAVMNSLLDAHLQGSNTAALGGDLSYQYATTGSLAGIGLGAAQASLAAGTDWQTLKSRSQPEQGSVRLMG